MIQASAKTDPRALIRRVHRIVVKIGSRVLVYDSGRPRVRRISTLAQSIAQLNRAGKEVVFVTSGAIGAGMEALGLRQRPTQLPELQMAAAVGQSRLMSRYNRIFSAAGCRIGQVLLTHDDLKHRSRHLNARTTMLTMLRTGVIPVVNENDVVAVDEIKFGDNDLLASLVTHLIDAELLILLTTSDGLQEFQPDGRSRRIPLISAVTREILALARGKGGQLSTGGMLSKLEAAHTVARAGAAVVIADGRQPHVIEDIMAGKDCGTLILPAAHSDLRLQRKRWIAFFQKPQGALVVDDGARQAIVQHHRSLLPVGVKAVQGEFPAGAVVDVLSADKTLLARGLTAYASHDVRRIIGKKSAAVAEILGHQPYYEEIIHRDNLAVLE